MTKPYTISTLIDDLQAIYAEHGDIDVVDGKGYAMYGDTVRVLDWEETYELPNGEETTEKGHTLAIGRRY